MSAQASTERIAQHFANISQEFLPLNYELLSDDVKNKIANASEFEIPTLTEDVVLQKILKSKKTKSAVPGDVPRRIVQEFSPEMATPMCKIFSNIAKSGHWPKS